MWRPESSHDKKSDVPSNGVMPPVFKHLFDMGDSQLKFPPKAQTFFYKIHSGTVSLDKDRYLTPAPNLRSTRAPHDSQYTRYMAYSDALKNSFFPRTIPLWNSLPSSVVSSQTAEEFKALI